MTDEQTNKARLVPIPTSAETLQLSVIREPLNDIIDDGSTLELVESAHQRSLLMFCKAMAYEKQDADSRDDQRAAKYKGEFYQYCKMVKSRQARKQRRVGTVQYGGL